MAFFTSTFLFVGIAKFLAKWIASSVTDDSSLAKDIASELAGDSVKKLSANFKNLFKPLQKPFEDIEQLFQAEISSGTIELEAVESAVTAALEEYLTPKLIAAHNYDTDAILSAILAKIAESNRSRAGRRATVGLSERSLDLFNRLLPRTAEVAISVAKALDGVRVASMEELLKRTDGVREGIAEAARALARIEAAAERAASGVEAMLNEKSRAFANYEATYRDALVLELNELTLFGLQLREGTAARSQPLDIAFLSLNLGDEEGDSAPATLDQILGRMRSARQGHPPRSCVMIRGDAGSGKSTLLKWAAIMACHVRFHIDDRSDGSSRGFDIRAMRDGIDESTRHAQHACRVAEGMIRSVDDAFIVSTDERPRPLPPSSQGWQDELDACWLSKVPILLRLRQCVNGHLPKTNDIIQLACPGLPQPPSGWVDDLLSKGRVLFLIDGVDEVPPQERATLYQELQSWLTHQTKAGNLFVISSRPLDQEPEWIRKHRFAEARVNSMTPNERDLLIDRWHEAVKQTYLEQNLPDLAGKQTQNAERLKKQLGQHAAVGRPAGNPLMCAMLCALASEAAFVLNKKAYEIIDTLCKVLLADRENATPGFNTAFPPAYLALGEPKRRSILARLAYEMVLAGISTTDISDLTKHVTDVIGTGNEQEAAEIAVSLVERSGLLSKAKRCDARLPVDFIHNTFKEFLASSRFGRSTVKTLISGCEQSSEIANICVFIAGREATPDNEELTNAILGGILEIKGLATPMAKKTAKKSASRPRRAALTAAQYKRYMLALRMREAAVSPLLEENRQRLDDIEESMFPPRTLADAEALAVLGNEAVPRLRWHDKLAPKQQIRCIHALGRIQTPEAEAELKVYARHADREDVVQELALVMEPLQIDWVWTRLANEEMTDIGAWRARAREIGSDLRHRIRRLPDAIDSSTNHLDLSNTGVTSLDALKDLTSLETLDLSDTGVTSLDALKSLTSLETLYLSRSGVTSLDALKGLTSLEILDLSDTDVTSLDALKGLTSLKRLSLSDTDVTSLDALKGLTSLERLFLSDTGVTSLDALKSLTSLETLYLSRSGVTSLEALKGLTSLKSLDISGTSVALLQPLEPLLTTGSLRIIVSSLAAHEDAAPLSAKYPGRIIARPT